MSNFIDESERHNELYGDYSDHQKEVLNKSSQFEQGSYTNDYMVETLLQLGVTEKEIEWLKRTGHAMPTYR